MYVVYSNIYIAPLQGIYSEVFSALAYMMLNVVVMNEFSQFARLSPVS